MERRHTGLRAGDAGAGLRTCRERSRGIRRGRSGDRSGAACPGAAASVSDQSCASAASASGERADKSSGGKLAWSAFCAFAGGGAATMAWALVPPKPKELTPASKGPLCAKVFALAATSRLSASKGMLGLGVSKCSEAGKRRFSSAMMVLIRPAMPDAVSRCPRLVLTDPIGSGTPRFCARLLPSAASSMGSPAKVPVPWASTKASWAGSIPAWE